MMLRKFVFAAAVTLALAACASDEEMLPEESATGAATSSGMPLPGTGVQGGALGGPGGAGYGAGGGQQTMATQAEQQLAAAGNMVFFAFDQYDLDDRAQQTLDRQASTLLRYAQVNVLIEGHTDERGTREYNLALGERRANAVKEYLVALGLNPGRIRTVSYGKERPLVAGSNESAWAQNRRAVTIVVGGRAGS